jgi:cardiolipin synthase A/B
MEQVEKVRTYHSSTEAWQAISNACNRALKSIDFEEYIIHDDRVGKQLLDILMIKAREGVRVRLLLDGFGSRRLRNHQVIPDLHEAGVQLVFYRPLNLFQRFVPTLSLPRNHAKTLHIDSITSFIGSMCIADHMLGWRDTLVELEGHVAARARLDFNRVWCRETLCIVYQPSIDDNKNESVLNTYSAQIPELGIAGILAMLLARVAIAKASILIATPYFFPPHCFRKALVTARARGVTITLLLASQTDIPLADTVTRGLIADWRQLGFVVTFYQPQVLHAKYAIIDDNWVTVGSCNFDFLSLKFNREANVVLRDPVHVEHFVRQSRIDLSNCLPVPATNAVQNAWGKAVGKFGALMSRLF